MDDELRGACHLLHVDLDQLLPCDRQKTLPLNYELWPEHALAWDVYLGCATQWRLSMGLGAALWQGLDYQGVEVVMRKYRVPVEEEELVFEQLQTLERETLQIVNRPKR